MTIKVAKTLRSLGDRLQTGASVRQVYGDPVAFAGRTVLPIARLRYGFGAGGGMGESAKPGSGRGGGGAGISVRPVGALEITEAGTRFIPFIDPVPLGLALLIGFLAGFRIGRRDRRR